MDTKLSKSCWSLAEVLLNALQPLEEALSFTTRHKMFVNKKFVSDCNKKSEQYIKKILSVLKRFKSGLKRAAALRKASAKSQRQVADYIN